MQNELPPEPGAAPLSLRATPSAEDIRAQLNRIITSPEFPPTGRGAAFLTYVIEETLAGRADRIKGYSVAVEVFKRDAGFTQDDPVVRIEAGRLRRILERYYLIAGHGDPIRIDIPKGGYVPVISWLDPSPDTRSVEAAKGGDGSTAAWRSRLFRRRWLILAPVVFAAVGILFFLQLSLFPSVGGPVSDEPTLAIAPFANLGGGPSAETYALGLTEEMLTALPRFKEIRVFGRETSKSLSPEIAISLVRNELGARFLLGGGVRVSGNLVRVTARLLDTQTGEILWSQIYDNDIQTRDQFAIQSDIANQVASAIAQPYGIMAQADAANPPPDDLGIQACMLAFYGYRAELSAERHAAVRDCLETAVASHPTFATAWAMLSMVYLDESRFKFNTRHDASTPIERSLQAARRAVQQDVNNTRGLQALMTALFFSNQVPEALKVGEQALSINPNDTELLGEFGTRVAMSGQWRRGADLLDRALVLNPGGGGYYHGTRALAAYMLNDTETALTEIKNADLQKFPLYHAVAAVIYVNAGVTDEARREATLFNNLRPDFIPNIVAELKSRNFRPADRARLIADIRKAGLPAVDEVEASMVLPADSSAIQPR
ncbi:adenylate cyclase [Rhizobium sp. R72]|uniref:adenylate cyclase n=1 Tax=unclassified Rhizobium TaxID=2613769 RepID=UPI000B52E39C|nr:MULTISPECIES: adenylate cyclase [unclassified Rhizobium]OWW04601.1 adenylate cyclase [Rhizobium sp. R72]OWW05658.1 adenylate cyclase [Rhizobium sp. R711]